MICQHDPKKTKEPIGMYHCPDCGNMVVAGCTHPDYDLLDNLTEEDMKIIKGEMNE